MRLIGPTTNHKYWHDSMWLYVYARGLLGRTNERHRRSGRILCRWLPSALLFGASMTFLVILTTAPRIRKPLPNHTNPSMTESLPSYSARTARETKIEIRHDIAWQVVDQMNGTETRAFARTNTTDQINSIARQNRICELRKAKDEQNR